MEYPNRPEEIVLAAARDADRAAWTALWTGTFGDGADYVDGFARHAGAWTLLARADGRVVAMLHLLRGVTLCSGGQDRPCGYLYALATEPAWRGRGLMRALVARAEEWARAQGLWALLLCPAEAGLVGYYERLGYEAWFWLPDGGTVCSSAWTGTNGAVRSQRADVQTYNQLRNVWLSGREGGVRLTGAALQRHLAADFAYSGLLPLQLRQGPDTGALAVVGQPEEARPAGSADTEKLGKILRIRELLCRGVPEEAAVRTLLDAFDCETVRFQRPDGPDSFPYGMGKRLDGESRAGCPDPPDWVRHRDGYMNLMFN